MSEIKQIFTDIQVSDKNISNTAQVWIDLFSNTAQSQSPKRISFPTFTWNRDDLPDKLYLREQENQLMKVCTRIIRIEGRSSS